jgi:hypothetical protein
MGTAREDWETLLMAILTQAMNDYVKLQHPKYRKKKYLQEAFDSAVKMLFDDTFEFMYLKNEYGDHMSLSDLLSNFISEKNMDLEKLRAHVINDAKIFWENKLLNVLDIPESFIYDGHVYDTIHTDDDCEIDYLNKKIYIDKENNNSDIQQVFIKAAVEIMLYHEEIPIAKKNIDLLAKAFFRMLKVNSCFLAS